MARPTLLTGKTSRAERRLGPGGLCAALALAVLVAAPVSRAQTPSGADDRGGSGFALVAQALRARLALVSVGRQDILWASPSAAEGMVQVVADVARAGGRTAVTYRFPAEAAGRVSLDDGTHSWIYDPAHQALVVARSAADDRAAASPAMLALLRRNYECLRMNRESVNGRPCDVVAVRPRAAGGPSKRLWIEAVRHAILRTEEYDARGCRRYVSCYESIRFPRRLPESALALPARAHDAATRRVTVETRDGLSAPQAFAAAGLPGRVPAWCPNGFTLMRCSVVGPRSGSQAVLLRYSDGLKSLLVMEEARAGEHPTAPELNGTLARYGQQAWVREEGSLRTVVRGDLSLTDALGAGMLQALSAHADGVLSQGLARDFGAAAARRGASLRRLGWGYEQISALCLWERKHPRLRARLKPLLDADAAWPRFADAFGSEADTLTGRARAWVSATLAAAR